VLEPIVNIEINAPDAKMGDIAGDLSAKRGQISGTQSASAGMVTIAGRAPLSELNNYQAPPEISDRGSGLLRHRAQSLRAGPAAGATATRLTT
jgi:elongation factor G